MKITKSLVLGAILAVQFGCGGGGSSEPSAETPVSPSEINGRAAKGILKSALVKAYEIDGQQENLIAEGRSDDKGYYALELDKSYQGQNPITLHITADDQTRMACDLEDCSSNEADVPVPELELKSISQAIEKGKNATVHTSVLTDIAAKQALDKLQSHGLKAEDIATIVQQISQIAGENPFTTAPIDITNSEELKAAGAEQLQIARIEAGILKQQNIKKSVFQTKANGNSFNNINQQLFSDTGLINSAVIKQIVNVATAASISESGSGPETSGTNAATQSAVDMLLASTTDSVGIDNHLAALEKEIVDLNKVVTEEIKSDVEMAKKFLSQLRSTVFLTDDRLKLIESFESLPNDLEAVVESSALKNEAEALMTQLELQLASCDFEQKSIDEIITEINRPCAQNNALSIAGNGSLVAMSELSSGSKISLTIDNAAAIAEAIDILDQDEEATTNASLALGNQASATISMLLKDSSGAEVANIDTQKVTLTLSNNDIGPFLSGIDFSEPVKLAVYGGDTASMEVFIHAIGFSFVQLPEQYAALTYQDPSEQFLQIDGIAVSANLEKDGMKITLSPQGDDYTLQFDSNSSALNSSIIGNTYIHNPIQATDNDVNGLLADLRRLPDLKDLPKRSDCPQIIVDSRGVEMWCQPASGGMLQELHAIEDTDENRDALNDIGVRFVKFDQDKELRYLGHYLYLSKNSDNTWYGEYAGEVQLKSSHTTIATDMTIEHDGKKLEATVNALIYDDEETNSDEMALTIFRPGANFVLDLAEESISIEQGDSELLLSTATDGPFGDGVLSYAGKIVATVKGGLVYWIGDVEGETIDFESLL